MTGTTTQDFVTQVGALSDERLSEMLARAHGNHRGGTISVGVLMGDDIAVATLDSLSGAHDETYRRPLGCAAKVLTGMLAMRAQTEGRLDFDCELSDIRGLGGEPVLAGLTPRHLLNHTSGLDASRDAHVPLSPGGNIDRRALIDRFGSRKRLFEPGQFYSYGSAGAWITAALLEQTYSADFASLVTSKVLRPAGIAVGLERQAPGHWCPATGAALALSVPELLRLLHWYLCQDELRTHPELRTPVTPPGWCLESGACAGWKYYGSGWYGHNVVLEPHSLVLRVHLEQRVAVVVAATHASASMTMTRIFGRVLPEYLRRNIPKPLPARYASPDTTGCTGVYANDARIVRISHTAEQKLEAEIHIHPSSSEHTTTVIRTSLTPGTDHAYLAEPAATRFMQWIQFLSPSENGHSHLWDGKEVLRRSALGCGGDVCHSRQP